MIRWTCELIPFGVENAKRKIGVIEIGNDGTGNTDKGNYNVVLKKTPPWRGALKETWRKGEVEAGDYEDKIIANVEGFHRIQRGVYDLLYRALVACDVHRRNPVKGNKT